MPLPRLSRLFPDAPKNPCVPATPSGVFDSRVLCDPTFSVGKARGALSPPQQPISAGQGAHPRVPGRGLPVAGLGPLVARRRRHGSPCWPQPPAGFRLPNFRLFNFQLSTVNYLWRFFFSLSPLECAVAQKCDNGVGLTTVRVHCVSCPHNSGRRRPRCEL
jgi:hypothetical protein